MLSLNSSIFVPIPPLVSTPVLPRLLLRRLYGVNLPNFSGSFPRNPLISFKLSAKMVSEPPKPSIKHRTVLPPKFVFPGLPPKSNVPNPQYPNPQYIIPPQISFPSVTVHPFSLTPLSIQSMIGQVPFVSVGPVIFDIPIPKLPTLTPTLTSLEPLVKQVFVNLFDYVIFNKKLSLTFGDYELVKKKSQPDYMSNMRKHDIFLANRRVTSVTSSSMAALVGEVKRRLLKSLGRWRQIEAEADDKRLKLLINLYENLVKQISASYKSQAVQYTLQLKSRIVNIKGLRSILRRNSTAIEALQASVSLSREAIDANETLIKVGESLNSLNEEAINITEKCLSAANKIVDISNTNNQILRDYIDGYLALVNASVESYKQDSYEANIEIIREMVSNAPNYALSLEAHYLSEANSLYKDFLELEAQIKGLNEKILTFDQLVSTIREGYDVEAALFQTRAQNLLTKGETRADEVSFGVLERSASLKEKFSDLLYNIKQAIEKSNMELKYLRYSLEAAQEKGRAQSNVSKAEFDRSYKLARSQLEMAVLEVLGS